MKNTISVSEIQYKDLNTSLALTILLGWTNFFAYRVPSGQVFKMTHFSNYMATADWGNVEWRITLNGVPWFPYESVLDQIGIATLPRMTEPLVAQGGDEVRIDATLLAAAVTDPNDIGIALKYEVM